MRVRRKILNATLPLLAVLLVMGCKRETPVPPAPPAPPAPPGTLIGPAGGTVSGPNGSSVVIPAGALTTEIRILIEQTATGVPALPAGTTAAGLPFALTPHGTTFAVPVTLTLPFDPAAAPGTSRALYKTTTQNQWEHLTNAVFGTNSVSAQISSFSGALVVVPPLVVGRPTHQWEVETLLGDALVPDRFVTGTQILGDLIQSYDFGPSDRDGPVRAADGSTVRNADGIATAQVAASGDGAHWWIGAEAPLGVAAIATDEIGMRTTFKQTQQFIKRASDARLTFTLNRAFIETLDANRSLGRLCPPLRKYRNFCDLIDASIFLEVHAFTVAAEDAAAQDFYILGGTASITGFAGGGFDAGWDMRARTASFSKRPLWNIGSFIATVEPLQTTNPFGIFLEALGTMRLRAPLPYEIDISQLPIGQSFFVQFTVFVTARNRAAAAVSGVGAEFDTGARAYLFDPQQIDGTTLTFTGLEPIDTVLPVSPPPMTPVPPAPCIPGPGPDPAAGTIQFSAPDYTQLESSNAPVVIVTRTGGSTGAVTATIATTNGTAIAGTDYEALNASVFFANGDAEEREVSIPIVADQVHSEPDKTVNLTLSQPGGCAALGTQTTAVLTIRDDDAPPPPTLFTVGGTVTGLTGTGLILENHRGLFLEIAGNGPFTFSSLPSPTGTTWFIRVFNQPRNSGGFQTQRCTVPNGAGVIGNENVTHVVVVCEDL